MAAFIYRTIVSVSLLLAGALSAQADVELVMVEEPGCFWCARWDREIGPIYPKTAEGRIAPLRKVEIYGPEIKDLDLKGRPAYTPTFILINDGAEVGRLEGYPGDDFFWHMIQQIIEKLPEEQRADPAS